MEKTNLLTLVVMLTVGIILAGSLLMPVLSDATITEKTFMNTGYYEMTYTEDDSLSFEWDYTTPQVATINGETVNLPTPPAYTPVNIVCGDDWFIRWDGNGMQLYSVAGGNNAAITASVATSTSMTITAASGSATIANTASTPISQTVSYTFMYFIDPSGNLLMKTSDSSAWLKGDSEIYAIGRSSTTGLLVKLKITGNIDDGFNASVVGTPGVTVTLGDVESVVTQNTSYVNLYSLQKLKIPITYGDANSEYTAEYSYFIVPASVTAELSQHLDAGEIALLNALPILVIIGLVMAGVGAIFIRNRD